jgi:hypothetical protein
MVTGASTKGTWVRLLEMPIEGRLKIGCQGIDVRDRIRVQLLSVDVEQGFIDFGRIALSRHLSDSVPAPLNIISIYFLILAHLPPSAWHVLQSSIVPSDREVGKD